MTEKRFKCVSDYDWWGVIDTVGEIKGEYDNDCFSTDTVVDLLNSLAEENKELKHENVNIMSDLDYYRTKSGSCEEGLFQKDREIAKFEKENKELKELIKKTLETTPIEHNLAVELKNSVREFYD